MALASGFLEEMSCALTWRCKMDVSQDILPSGERAGFFIGDGAGVGKGRQISGIILDNFVRGRRCVACAVNIMHAYVTWTTGTETICCCIATREDGIRGLPAYHACRLHCSAQRHP